MDFFYNQSKNPIIRVIVFVSYSVLTECDFTYDSVRKWAHANL